MGAEGMEAVMTGRLRLESCGLSAGKKARLRTMVLVSGGSLAGDDFMIEKAEESMSAGATGLIFGRNVWQRDHDESLRFVDRLREILAKYPTP
jgi:class I fructose-bisphosphate aldolase